MATATALVVGLLAPAGARAATSGAGGHAASGPGAAAPARQVKVIVRFKAPPGAAGERAIENAGGKVRFRYTIVPSLAATMPLAALDGLRHNPNVADIELDGHLTAFDHAAVTGDLEYENAWGVEHIGSKPVHDAGIRGDGIRVAVIDTGIDYIHDIPAAQEPPVVDPEFNGTYRGGWDFVNNDADPLDDNGHGTHVSGILAADHNGYLVVGVAPEVELYALKVLGATGEGDYSGLIAALDWAVRNDMDVVNMSLGGRDVSATLQAAVEAAANAGVVLVAAAGNVNPLVWQELFYGCAVAYPAAYPEVLATTFTNGSDALTGYSCTGNAVDFAAPGDQVFSPVPVGPAGSCMFCSPYGYSAQSGTSMASPHLAGLVALVLDHGIADADGDGRLMPEIKAHLCASTVPGTRSFSGWTYAQLYGCGVINARKALLENPPPVGTGAPEAVDDVAATAEDTSTDVDVLANDSDADGDPLTVTAVSAPAHGAASINADGTVLYAPAPDYHGPDAFTYTVGDGLGNASTANVSVTVTPVNDPPVATPDELVTPRDQPATIDVLANDTDVDADPLAVAAVTQPDHGAVAFSSDGLLTYTPSADYSGPDTFTYTVVDGAGGSAAGQVLVTVVAVNHPPVANPDAATTAEDQAVYIDVVANDTDVDGGILSATDVAQPAHGSATIAGDGTVLYQPWPDYHGPDVFTYVVRDGLGATATTQVEVTVTPVNDAPVAVDDVASTLEDTPVNVDAAANDTDVDGDPLAVVTVGAPTFGSAVVEHGQVVYTPSPNAYGTATMSYTVGDGAGGTDAGMLSVSVAPVNDAPTAASTSASTSYQTAVTVTLTGTDVETCDLGFQVVSPPANGTLTTPTNVLCVTLLPPYSDSSKVTYTPKAGFSGTDSFTYRTSDGALTSLVATVTITVRPAVELHVGDLEGSRTIQSKAWTARVVIRAHDASEGSVGGVTVSGSWSTGGTASCRTGSSGTCSVSKSKIPRATPEITFSVTDLTGATGVYVPGSNHDLDGDSNGTSIRITQL
jgi:subtilisin family serine protease